MQSPAPAASLVSPDALLPTLARQGWAVADGAFPARFWAHLAALQRPEGLAPAGTGRAGTFRAHGVRGDRVRWLSTDGPDAERAVLEGLDGFRQRLNAELRANAHEVEAHVACYPPGHGYPRHVDGFRQGNRRVVSLVCYLNPGWRAEDGGCLRLHLPDGPKDVVPLQGRCVAFASEEIEHEVLPGTRERWSLAAWFRRRA